jgi:type II secretory pathway component PulF
MATVERLILRMERFSARLVQYLPILGAAARAEREARWLAALTLALESGVTPPDALRSAGLVCGGRIEMRSEAASASVAKGLRIGAACREHHVLSRNTLQRLAFLDGSNDFVAGVRLISEDTTFDALSTMARAAKVAELVGMLFLGTVMGFFALSVYLPLFYISRNIRFEL